MQAAKPSTGSQSIAAILPYWKPINDAILHVDGRITGGFELEGYSLECRSEEALSQLQNQLRVFLHTLPQAMDVQFLYQVRPFSPVLERFKRETEERNPLSHIWRDKISYLERLSNIWHTRLFLFCTLPKSEDAKTQSLLSRIGLSWKSMHAPNPLHGNQAWEDRRYLELHHAMNDLRSALASLEMRHRALAAEELIQLLYEFLNPTRSGQIEFTVPKEGWPANRTIREEITFSSVQIYPREMIFDDCIHRVISLRDIPQMQFAGIINRLLTLREFPFDLSVGVVASDPQAVLAHFKRSETMQANLQKGRGRNYEAEQQQQDLSLVIQELVRGDTKVYKLSFAIHYAARSEKELSKIEARLRQEIHQMAEARELREEFSYPETFVATLPGASHRAQNPLETITPQALALLPVYQSSRGSPRPVALFKTRTDELVASDPFDGRLTAFNGVIFGPTGRGKSFLAQYLLLQYLRVEPRIFIIDVGGSYRRFTRLLGGDYVDLQQDTQVALNPFLPRDGEPEPELVGFIAGIIERMVKNEGDAYIDKVSQHLIRESIHDLYRQKSLPLNLEGYRSLMTTKAESSNDPEDKAILKSFSKRLALWTEGEGKGLLVGERSLSLDQPVVTVDLAGLSANKELQGVVIQILSGLIWHQVRKASGPKIVLFDEVWQHLKDPTAAKLLDQLYRTARKHHTSVLSISQQLEDFLSADVQTSIIANSATRFILRTDRELTQLRQVFQLNDAEIALIQGLTMRRGHFSEIFATIGDDHFVLRIEPSPSEYWLCTTHPQDLAVEREFIEKNPTASVREIIEALANSHPRGVQ